MNSSVRVVSFYGLDVHISQGSKYPPVIQEAMLNAVKPLFDQISDYAKNSTCKDTIARDFATKKPAKRTLSICFFQGSLFINLRDKELGMLNECTFDEFITFVEPDILKDILYKTELMSNVDKNKIPFFAIGPGINSWNIKIEEEKKKREKEEETRKIILLSQQAEMDTKINNGKQVIERKKTPEEYFEHYKMLFAKVNERIAQQYFKKEQVRSDR